MGSQKRCLIVTGGTVDLEFAASYIGKRHYEFVIAVDKGLIACHKLGCNVDYILGDFDSVDSSILEIYKDKKGSYEIKTLNPEKDMTDTEDAIMVALEHGVTEIELIGATGTRIDHMLANINLLMKPLKNCVKACILDKNNRIYVKNDNFTISKEEVLGTYISFLPLTSEVTGVTLRGFKYPLQDYTLTIGNSLGVSNEMIEEVATVTVGQGVLIVIESRD